MTEKLERNKEYEWFLKSYNPVKGPGGTRLKLVWVGVDVDYEIAEYPLLREDGTAGPRLVELIQRMNGTLGKPTNGSVIPGDHLKRGIHLFAHVHRHFTETKTDAPVYEFVYETISLTPEALKQEVPASARKKILFRVSQSKTVDEVRSRLGVTDPSLIPWFEQMVKNGEVVFA